MMTSRVVYTDTITYGKNEYEIFCIPRTNPNGDSMYDIYIQPTDRSFAMALMFGLYTNDTTLDEAMEIAKDRAPEYIDMFFEHEWI